MSVNRTSEGKKYIKHILPIYNIVKLRWYSENHLKKSIIKIFERIARNNNKKY